AQAVAHGVFGIAHDAAVDLHAAGLDPARGLGARAQPGLGQDPGQAMADAGPGSPGRGGVRAARPWRRAHPVPQSLVGAAADSVAGAEAVAAGAGAPLATRTPRAFIHASNSSAVMRLPFWLMSKRQGVLSYSVCGLYAAGSLALAAASQPFSPDCWALAQPSAAMAAADTRVRPNSPAAINLRMVELPLEEGASVGTACRPIQEESYGTLANR